jgi:16S rRNA G966 N2-methylase RsmD
MWRNDFLPNPKSQMGANHSITEIARNIIMLKSTLVAAAFAIAFIQPAFAEDAMMKCDDASMMKMQTEMDAMTGAAMKKKKEMAMKEMDMAKKAMKEKKTDDCMMHMEGAMKAMKK